MRYRCYADTWPKVNKTELFLEIGTHLIFFLNYKLTININIRPKKCNSNKYNVEKNYSNFKVFMYI